MVEVTIAVQGLWAMAGLVPDTNRSEAQHQEAGGTAESFVGQTCKGSDPPAEQKYTSNSSHQWARP